VVVDENGSSHTVNYTFLNWKFGEEVEETLFEESSFIPAKILKQIDFKKMKLSFSKAEDEQLSSQ